MDRTTIKKTLLAIILVIIAVTTCIPQSALKNKESFLEAESYFLYEEFTEALPLYIQLKELMPANYYLDYKIGRCYLNMAYDKAKAIKYLETAIKHISNTSKEGSFKETMAPIDAIFYLGDAYRINNKLDKAIESYEHFKSQVNPSSYDLKLVDTQIASCKRAIEAMKKPVDLDVEIIGNPINTRQSETNPVVSQDESMMVYTAKLQFYNALFYSKKINGKWQEPVNMIPELGVDDDCYPTCLSYDGKELYIYRTNEYKGDLFVTHFENGKWTKLKKLNSAINTKYWESHASISRDGKRLYFTSNREGGYGGLDIYVSHRLSGDEWGAAENLGATINSPYNEETPFIMPDDKTLYFSSFGHETIGGYDIFYSVHNGSWSKPENLGYPINSTDDDIFLYPLRGGEIVYGARFMPNGAGKYDLVRMNIYTDKNPRKYLVNGFVKLPGKYPSNTVFSLALYDRIKKDTILRKTFTATSVAFETIPGQYDIYISSPDKIYQGIPLTIKYGSKDTKLTMEMEMIERRAPEPKFPVTIVKNDENTEITAPIIFKQEDLLAQTDNVINGSLHKQSNDTGLINKSQTDNTLEQTIYADTANLDNKPAQSEQKPSEGGFQNFIQNPLIIYMGIGLIGIFLFVLFIIIRKKKKT